MVKKNVLIFPCGTEGGINILNMLKYNLHFNVYGLSGKKNYSDFIYPVGNCFYEDESFYITNSDFEIKFSEFIIKHQIDFVIPTFDDVALKLMEIQDKLSAKIICSPIETVKIAYSKKEMYKKLVRADFIPETYADCDEIKKYPVFVKPSVGMGSENVYVVRSKEELVDIIKNQSDMVICEYLPGEEYTVDCFTNRHGELLFVGPRKRERVWHGISFRVETVPLTSEFKHISHTLNQNITFRGAWFFQVKKDFYGNLKLLEFSARQATNSCFYSNLGVNFSLLSLFDAMDNEVTIIYNELSMTQERCLSGSYKLEYNYDVAYIDYDDTLIIDKHVNTLLMQYIYKCINKRIKVVLLTRHFGDLYTSMAKYRINPSVFDNIIWIKDGSMKSKYINQNNAIFIDNATQERLDVKRVCGIPVFDVDALLALIDTTRI